MFTEKKICLLYTSTFDNLYEKYKEEAKKEQEAVRAAGGLAIIGTERHELSGRPNAAVFPVPVCASATTSLFSPKR